MGNRPCHQCLSCYDEDIDRAIILNSLSVSPLNFRGNQVNKAEQPEKNPTESNPPPFDTSTEAVIETTSSAPRVKSMYHMDDGVMANVSPSKIQSTSPSFQHDNFHNPLNYHHISKTFSSEHFRSMSSESLGRETRTEKSILRRLSSACERDDLTDENHTSRSFT